MTTSINDININIIDGVNVVRGAGFGIPLLVSRTAPNHVLSNTSFGGLIFKGSSAFNLKVTVTANATTTFSKASGANTPVALTYNGSVSTQNIISAYNSAEDAVKNAVSVVAPSSPGTFDVGATSGTDYLGSTTFTYRGITSRDELLGFYETASPEYKIVSNMFGQKPSPLRIYVLPVASSANFETSLSARDNGDWYAVLSTLTTANENANIASYVETRKRIGFVISGTIADIKNANLAKDNTVRVYHTSVDDRPDAAWAAANLPKQPGSITWAKQANLVGQTPSTASLSELVDLRDNHINSYVKATETVNFWQDGFIGNTDRHIDQIRGRHWIEDSISTALLSALASEEKIPYDARGINLVVGIITEKLEIAGENGLIAVIEDTAEADDSSSNNYRFSVSAPTRAEITAASPSDIVNRSLRNVTFSYVEAGAIQNITVTGRVTL